MCSKNNPDQDEIFFILMNTRILPTYVRTITKIVNSITEFVLTNKTQTLYIMVYYI